MVRRRLPMEFIPNETSRRRTFRTRKNNLMKKAHEFTTLCGVSACMIIYNREESAEAVTYPPERDTVREIIEQYQQNNGTKKALGLSDFFTTRRKKLETELRKIQEENRYAKYPLPHELINSFSKEELASLHERLEVKSMAAKNRLAVINMTKTDGDDTHYIQGTTSMGVRMGMNVMVENPTAPRFNYFSHPMSEVTWTTSIGCNSYNSVEIPDHSNGNYYNIQPLATVPVPNNTLMSSSLPNPSNILCDYGRSASAAFCSPQRLAMPLPPHQQPPMIQYPGSSAFCNAPSMAMLPPSPLQQKPQMMQFAGPGGFCGTPSRATPVQLPQHHQEFMMQNPSSSCNSHFYFDVV